MNDYIHAEVQGKHKVYYQKGDGLYSLKRTYTPKELRDFCNTLQARGLYLKSVDPKCLEERVRR